MWPLGFPPFVFPDRRYCHGASWQLRVRPPHTKLPSDHPNQAPQGDFTSRFLAYAGDVLLCLNMCVCRTRKEQIVWCIVYFFVCMTCMLKQEIMHCLADDYCVCVCVCVCVYVCLCVCVQLHKDCRMSIAKP